VNWEQIIKAEPLLAQLESLISRADVPLTMSDYYRKWVQFKRLMQLLVGFEAIAPSLRNSDAYDLVHDRLLQLYEHRADELSASGGEQLS
jgi:hypothetical protein